MCALGAVLGVVAHGVKVAGGVGDGMADAARLMPFGVWLLMGVKAAQIGARVLRSVWRVCS